jgi:hypothetical protein
VKASLTNPDPVARGQYLELMRGMVSTLPALFPELQCLVDTDQEVDFFFNMTHLQVRRRHIIDT